jgi:hypothetical protein
MIERGRGSVTNVASLAALQPMPGNATYAATKAFVASLGPAVHAELRGTGVTVTTVLPGFTRTEFQQRAGTEQDVARVPSFLWMSPEAVAGSALAAAARGQPWWVPGGGYRVAAAVVDVLPRGLLRTIAGRSGGVSRSRPPRTSSAW